MVSLEKCELIGLQIVHLLHTLSGISKVHQPETHLIKVEVGIWNKDMTPDLKMNTLHLHWKNLSTPASFCSSECLPGTRIEITSPYCWDCVVSSGNHQHRDRIHGLHSV